MLHSLDQINVELPVLHNLQHCGCSSPTLSGSSTSSDARTKQPEHLLEDFNSGTLMRARDDCDAAFGWNNQMRSDMGSAAARVGQ